MAWVPNWDAYLSLSFQKTVGWKLCVGKRQMLVCTLILGSWLSDVKGRVLCCFCSFFIFQDWNIQLGVRKSVNWTKNSEWCVQSHGNGPQTKTISRKFIATNGLFEHQNLVYSQEIWLVKEKLVCSLLHFLCLKKFHDSLLFIAQFLFPSFLWFWSQWSVTANNERNRRWRYKKIISHFFLVETHLNCCAFTRAHNHKNDACFCLFCLLRLSAQVCRVNNFHWNRLKILFLSRTFFLVLCPFCQQSHFLRYFSNTVFNDFPFILLVTNTRAIFHWALLHAAHERNWVNGTNVHLS